MTTQNTNATNGSYHWEFTTEAEARDFLAGEKESLAKTSGFDYAGSDLSYDEVLDEWRLRVDYVQTGPEAA